MSTDFPDSPSPFVSIAFGRYSKQHPVSVQGCYRLVLAGHATPIRLCEGVHRRMSLMSLPLLIQQYSACLVRRI